MCTSLSVDRKYLFQLAFLKLASVQVSQVPLQVFISSECLLFNPICLLYGNDFFQAFRSMANKRYKW